MEGHATLTVESCIFTSSKNAPRTCQNVALSLQVPTRSDAPFNHSRGLGTTTTIQGIYKHEPFVKRFRYAGMMLREDRIDQSIHGFFFAASSSGFRLKVSAILRLDRRVRDLLSSFSVIWSSLVSCAVLAFFRRKRSPIPPVGLERSCVFHFFLIYIRTSNKVWPALIHEPDVDNNLIKLIWWWHSCHSSCCLSFLSMVRLSRYRSLLQKSLTY